MENTNFLSERKTPYFTILNMIFYEFVNRAFL